MGVGSGWLDAQQHQQVRRRRRLPLDRLATLRAEIGSPTESVQRNLVVQVNEVWMRQYVAGLAEIGLDRRGHR